ncbi:MAG: hypothetical protein JSV66_11115 [Trueperaceae bacterium]|nr:MAG: hypothetical protein JSV66_11115 [Trueperaceae bacterium]
MKMVLGMGRVLDMMRNAIDSTWVTFRLWMETLAWNPLSWGLLTWILVAVLLVVIFFLLSRPRLALIKPELKPDLLISQGEVIPEEPQQRGARGGVGTGIPGPDQQQNPDSAYVGMNARMNISNLNTYPVQLLELAICTNVMDTPHTVTLSSLLSPHSRQNLSVELPPLEGLDGQIELYLYTAQARHKTYCIRSKLVWEPWNKRFTIAPLEQRIIPVRMLASTREKKKQEREWRRKQAKERAATEAAEKKAKRAAEIAEKEAKRAAEAVDLEEFDELLNQLEEIPSSEVDEGSKKSPDKREERKRESLSFPKDFDF